MNHVQHFWAPDPSGHLTIYRLAGGHQAKRLLTIYLGTSSDMEKAATAVCAHFDELAAADEDRVSP